MSTEPTYDASNVHLAQGQTVATAQFLAAADTGSEAADPDAPIYYGLTPKAETYLAPLNAELSPARAGTEGITVTEPAIDDGYAEAAAEDRAEAGANEPEAGL